MDKPNTVNQVNNMDKPNKEPKVLPPEYDDVACEDCGRTDCIDGTDGRCMNCGATDQI